MKTLEQQMSVYLQYHRNAKNRATHFVGVPLIIFSILIPMTWPHVTFGSFTVTAAEGFVVVVLAYYMLLDIPLAAGMAVATVGLLCAAIWVVTLGHTIATTVFVLCFVGGWILQLVGHVFEGKKPALLDNFMQIFVAPIFLLAELYFALGYRRDIQARMEQLAAR